MKVRKNNFIEVRKNNYLTRVYPDGNIHHVAHVQGYSIGIGIIDENGRGTTHYTPEMTLDDLKELRKVIRKVIKNESH